MSHGRVKVIASTLEFESLLALPATSTPLVVVDFFATWCGPCKSLAPKLAALSLEPANAAVEFASVDVDKQKALARRL